MSSAQRGAVKPQPLSGTYDFMLGVGFGFRTAVAGLPTFVSADYLGENGSFSDAEWDKVRTRPKSHALCLLGQQNVGKTDAAANATRRSVPFGFNTSTAGMSVLMTEDLIVIDMQGIGVVTSDAASRRSARLTEATLIETVARLDCVPVIFQSDVSDFNQWQTDAFINRIANVIIKFNPNKPLYFVVVTNMRDASEASELAEAIHANVTLIPAKSESERQYEAFPGFTEEENALIHQSHKLHTYRLLGAGKHVSVMSFVSGNRHSLFGGRLYNFTISALRHPSISRNGRNECTTARCLHDAIRDAYIGAASHTLDLTQVHSTKVVAPSPSSEASSFLPAAPPTAILSFGTRTPVPPLDNEKSGAKGLPALGPWKGSWKEDSHIASSIKSVGGDSEKGASLFSFMSRFFTSITRSTANVVASEGADNTTLGPKANLYAVFTQPIVSSLPLDIERAEGNGILFSHYGISVEERTSATGEIVRITHVKPQIAGCGPAEIKIVVYGSGASLVCRAADIEYPLDSRIFLGKGSFTSIVPSVGVGVTTFPLPSVKICVLMTRFRSGIIDVAAVDNHFYTVFADNCSVTLGNNTFMTRDLPGNIRMFVHKVTSPDPDESRIEYTFAEIPPVRAADQSDFSLISSIATSACLLAAFALFFSKFTRRPRPAPVGAGAGGPAANAAMGQPM